MDSAVSVSKGVFTFKNGLRAAKKSGRKRKMAPKRDPLTASAFSNELWYQSYYRLWDSIEKGINLLNENIFESVLRDVVKFVKVAHSRNPSEIPTATLLTGINMPDHAVQFRALANEIKKHVTPHVAFLTSQDSQTVKSLVETTVRSIITPDEDIDEDEEVKGMRKSHCNLSLLKSWFLEEGEGRPLVIILPDFEGFQEAALQDFIQIISFHIQTLPFVLIFGVATSLSTLHKTLPYQVLSKLNIQVFQSRSSTVYLNNVLESVLISDDCPFHLGGKLFTLFTDIFLFYDLSATSFIQNVKYAMLEHFSTGNAKALCASRDEIRVVLNEFTHADFENVRRLHSFRTLVEFEGYENRIKLLEDDAYFREVLEEKLSLIHDYLERMHLLLACLRGLVGDLPKTPLGKQLRELYSLTVGRLSLAQTHEFQEAFQLLQFQAKHDLIGKIEIVCKLFKDKSKGSDDDFFCNTLDNLNSFLEELKEIGECAVEEDVLCEEMSSVKLDRKRLKEALLSKTKQQNKSMTKFERVKKKTLNYIRLELMEKHLPEPTAFAFHEIFFFNDISLQNNVIGSHRAAIHTALNDPTLYLQCACCDIPNEATILNTMPDICIAYKLHLEYGKMINLYDWLQAFLCILDPQKADEEDSKRNVDPQLQARFTQCVAELEFLGFVKSSKRKTDHVSRLTWGG